MDQITNATLPWDTNYNVTNGGEFTVSTTSQNYTDLWATTEAFNVSTEIFNVFTDIFNVSTEIFNASTLTYDTEASTRWTPKEIARMIHIIVRPLLIVFGTIGNALTFYIMRTSSLRKRSTCFYMAVLALTDTGKGHITIFTDRKGS